MCIKDGLNTTIDKSTAIQYLRGCDDLKKDEVYDIEERTAEVEAEFVECVGNDNDSYWMYTFNDSKGEIVAVIEVYCNRDFINLLEYEEL
ncbi:hypothetical protein UT300012_23810 [Paraclostridium bifermentans]